MTSFGIFACAVLLGATLSGIGVGLFAMWINDPSLAWLAGGVAFAPFFLIAGRVWVKEEMRMQAASKDHP